jgi:hypothetical protein
VPPWRLPSSPRQEHRPAWRRWRSSAQTSTACMTQRPDDAIALEAAVRLGRALALASLRESSVQLDVPTVQEALAEIVRQVGEVTGMKSRMTSISPRPQFPTVRRYPDARNGAQPRHSPP